MSQLPSFAVIADAHIYRVAGIQDRYLQWAISAAASAGAAFAIIAGDLVEDGHRCCYDNAAAILRHSALPCYPTIGNKELSQNSTQRYRSYFGPTCYTTQHAGYRLIVLGTHDFRVPPHRLRWLRTVLEETAPHQRTIVATHHYLANFAPDNRDMLTDALARHGIEHIITAHRHRMETTRYGPVTEHLLQAADPDKALGSMPGFTMCRLHRGQLQTRFVAANLAPVDLRRHLLEQLGLAPTGTWHPGREIADLCRRHPLCSYQLRIGNPDSHAMLGQEAQMAQACGLQLVAHLPTPQFDAAGCPQNLPQMQAAADLCADLMGAGQSQARAGPVVLHPPKLPADMLCDRHGAMQASRPAVRRMVEAYTKMVGCMQQRGLAVALENNSSKQRRTTFGALPSHLTGLAEALQQQGLSPGYCFDVGHAKASVTQAQMAQWMAAIGDRLLALHLHSGDPHSHTTHQPIEELYSTTRWYGLGAWLAHKRLTVPCLLEVRSPEAAVRSIATLSRLTTSGREGPQEHADVSLQ